MNRRKLQIPLLLSVLVFAATLSFAGSAEAGDGLVRTDWPSAEDPGMPFYARVELLPPYIFNDGDWAAVIFYRDPACVPPDFNLISVFDIPGAFSCPHSVRGTSLWEGEAFNGAPKVINIMGNGAVPVWFVPWDTVQAQANANGQLTVSDLEQIAGRVVGYADHYTELLQPHPMFGAGGHPVPKMIVNATGELEDGRPFKLHINWVDDEVQALNIEFD